MFTCQFIEGNDNGRIVKVIEANGKTVTTRYVRHSPSRLVKQAKRGDKGRFTNETVLVPMVCPASEATGWMFAGNHDFLGDARAALGINTAPKRPAAVARALALAA